MTTTTPSTNGSTPAVLNTDGLPKTAAWKAVLDNTQLPALLAELEDLNKQYNACVDGASIDGVALHSAKNQLADYDNNLYVEIMTSGSNETPAPSGAELERRYKLALAKDQNHYRLLTEVREQEAAKIQNDASFDKIKQRIRIVIAEIQGIAASLDYVAASKVNRAVALAIIQEA